MADCEEDHGSMSNQIVTNQTPSELAEANVGQVAYRELFSPRWTVRLRWLRRIGYVVIPLVCSVYGYHFWTLEPAGAQGAANDASLLKATVRELEAAAVQLPAAKIPTTQPRARWGVGWTLPGTAEVYLGKWDTSDPNSAHALAATFAQLPETQAAFDQARRVLERFDAQRTSRITFRDPIDSLRSNDINVAQLADLMFGLCAAARVAVEVDDDPDRALALLRTALPIARLMDQIDSWQAYGNLFEDELAPLDELMQTLQQTNISAAAAQATADALEEYLSYAEAIDDFAGIGRDLEAVLDRFYASEQDGGWLVVNRSGLMLVNFWRRQALSNDRLSHLAQPGWGFWNLGTLMFDRRQKVYAQIKASQALAHETAEYPSAAMYDSDDEHYLPLPDTKWSFPAGRNSGLYYAMGRWMNRNELQSLRAIVSMRRVLYVMACIAQYRAEHGQLPASLAEIEADRARPLPLDLNTNQPFLYEMLDDGYSLNSAAAIHDIDRSDPSRAGQRRNWRAYLYARPAKPVDEDEEPAL